MPYKSEAQRRKFHAMLNEGKISKEVVSEFDSASKGKKLPERISKKGKGVVQPKGIDRLKSKLRKMK
jgi:5,10-methylenetetrahydrofolate reductase